MIIWTVSFFLFGVFTGMVLKDLASNNQPPVQFS